MKTLAQIILTIALILAISEASAQYGYYDYQQQQLDNQRERLDKMESDRQFDRLRERNDRMMNSNGGTGNYTPNNGVW